MQTLNNIYSRVKGIFSLSFFLFPFLLHAQEADSTMNQSVRLERDFSPVVQQKTKIDRQPAVQEVKQNRSNASYIDWKVDPIRSSEIGVVPAGEVISTDRQEQVGYLELSAGNYWNTDLKAGLISGDFRIDAQGFFTQSRLKLPCPVLLSADSLGQKKWRNRLLDGQLMGTYSTTLDNDAQFTAHLGASGTTVKTFNYSFYGLSTDTLQQTSPKTRQQHWGRILGDAAYVDDAFSIGLNYEFNGLTAGDSLQSDWRNNMIMLSGTYGIYDHDTWQLSFDLNLGGVFGKKENYFIMHPTMHLSVMPDGLSWRRFYGDLGFGRRRESISQVMNQVPLAYMETDYKPSVDCINLTLGYEDNEQGYLRWGLSAKLAYVEDDLGFEAVPADSTGFGGMYMRTVQDDCFTFGAQAHVDYEYNKYFGARASFAFESQSSDYINTGAPNARLNLHAFSNPGRVKMDLGLDFGMARHLMYNGQLYDLDPIVDLNFRLDYECSESFRLYAFANNILNRHDELWPAIPSQGINLHAGFRWDF